MKVNVFYSHFKVNQLIVIKCVLCSPNCPPVYLYIAWRESKSSWQTAQVVNLCWNYWKLLVRSLVSPTIAITSDRIGLRLNTAGRSPTTAHCHSPLGRPSKRRTHNTITTTPLAQSLQQSTKINQYTLGEPSIVTIGAPSVGYATTYAHRPSRSLKSGLIHTHSGHTSKNSTSTQRTTTHPHKARQSTRQLPSGQTSRQAIIKVAPQVNSSKLQDRAHTHTPQDNNRTDIQRTAWAHTQQTQGLQHSRHHNCHTSGRPSRGFTSLSTNHQ